MQPLTWDDLLPPEEYAGRRDEFFEAHQRYLDRYRRVRVGPHVTLLFENRQTMWFRVQELLRITSPADRGRVQKVLDVYNRLLPGRDVLQAALLIDPEEANRLRDLAGGQVRLVVGEQIYPARLLAGRPEDRGQGAAHWVEFPLNASGRQLLADFDQPAYFEIGHPASRHQSLPLGSEIRQSLLDDLKMSDKD